MNLLRICCAFLRHLWYKYISENICQRSFSFYTFFFYQFFLSSFQYSSLFFHCTGLFSHFVDIDSATSGRKAARYAARVFGTLRPPIYVYASPSLDLKSVVRKVASASRASLIKTPTREWLSYSFLWFSKQLFLKLLNAPSMSLVLQKLSGVIGSLTIDKIFCLLIQKNFLFQFFFSYYSILWKQCFVLLQL